jgi:prepilin-type N-terminal cleavage/methylation domain-containing protein
MSRTIPNRGITLVEVLVVVAVLALLMALLLPGMQSVRESARRTHCANNLKGMGLALQNFQHAHDEFPIGTSLAPTGTVVSAVGHTWWVRILPMVELVNVYNDFDKEGLRAPPYYSTGYLGYSPPPGIANIHNAAVVDGLDFPFAWCPSSPLIKFGAKTPYNPKGRPQTTYTGVAGSSNHATAHTFVDNDASSSNVVNGRVSYGGFFPRGVATNPSEFSDGLSTTLSVVEQSDWCRTASGSRADCRSDCGHALTMGTKRPASGKRDDRIFNTTTLRYAINMKDYHAGGVSGNCGPNRPMQSAHIGGAMALLADGSVHFLNELLDLQTLYNLADRDDGNTVVLP